MATESSNEKQIGAVPAPRCRLCGGGGEFIHLEQRDRLFDADGLWDFKRCLDPQCRLVWLDPMPLAEDIGKAYANYYTHAAQNSRCPPGLLKRLYLLMKRAYLAGKYGYRAGVNPWIVKLVGGVLYLFPIRRGGVDGEVRFLNAVSQGRLLDVGCGSGDWLLTMRELGWQVDGVDFDMNAVAAGDKQGLNLRCGALEDQNFTTDTFDAVTLNHVIEHVPHPVETLQECLRVLKPGGTLALFTPNSAALGHRMFKQDWRGLEPPRHLHIFCPSAMRSLLTQAGFHNISVQTTNSDYVWRQSYALWLQRTGNGMLAAEVFRKLATVALTLFEQMLLVAKPESGESLAVLATKQ